MTEPDYKVGKDSNGKNFRQPDIYIPDDDEIEEDGKGIEVDVNSSQDD